MSTPIPLAHFTDDDLARAPALLDGVIAELTAFGARPPHGRAVAAAGPSPEALLALALTRHRRRLVADYHAALARRVNDERERRGDVAPAGRSATPRIGTTAVLTLVDEDTIAADIQAARVADLVRSVAEHELRELGALLAALAGDEQVTCHRLVLQPDAHARALWHVARLLSPGQDGLATEFMSQAARPLADALRRHWAAACTRLEDAGITPAAYRTVILQAGIRVQPEAPPTGVALPAPGLVPRGHGREDAPASPASGAATVARTFDVLQTHPHIGADLKPAIGRLRDPALRAAASDPALASGDDHPLWALIDRIAWQGESLPPPPQRERVRTMQVINGLVDQLARDERPDAARFQWALARLVALEQNRLERRIGVNESQVAALAVVERELMPERPGDPADATERGQLPTVPADLYAPHPGGSPTGAADAEWIDRLAVGDLARLQIEGNWALAQLLWRSSGQELFLWVRCAGDEAWPVRRSALVQLYLGGLAVPTKPTRIARDIARAQYRAAAPGQHVH